MGKRTESRISGTEVDTCGLDERRSRVLAALLTTSNREETARMAGVSTRTVRRYLAEPAFSAAYEAALNQQVDEALNISKAGLVEASRTLRDVMGDSVASPTAKVSAARAMLDFFERLAEFREIERRLDALEASSGEGID